METKLYEASLKGDVEALKTLLHQDQLILDRISLTAFNESPLHIAAMRRHLTFATFLLTQNPKLAMALDTQKRTPLHLAAADGNLEMVRELLRFGGQGLCGSRDHDGLTPLHLAAMNEHLEVVKVLVQVNPQAAKEIPATGETILHMCVRYNRFESFKVLTELWDDDELAKITDLGGNTLLHAAAINRQIQILNYLLQKPCIKANGNAVNRHGLTPLDVLDHCSQDVKALETRANLMEAGVLRVNDLRPLSKPLQSSIKSSDSKQKGFISRTWARYLNDDHHWLEKQRGILIVAALVVAVMSVHSGLNPPGGTISNTQDGRFELGNAVQTEVDMDQYNQFVAYNTITMIISLAIVLVLISGFPLRNKFWMWVLTIGTLFAMVFMVVTYYHSLTMIAPDGYVDVGSVWICLIWMLACGILALIHTIFFVVWVVMKLSKSKSMETQTKSNRSAIEV
ncbi:ankyrin repeat-containing protein ITN1-like [Cynara cardunculus var. scolymus]|uniref:Ankyrin repeat-containing protein n=1 Tax=Cynara cardunculus var. scolymus TaxID=59895 RepID=A0A103WLB2_CYNCS|nr:ankyrin repeat-containing protein ITN1-like [Cynara cardunculus var. scolymus]KVH74491.1 Ankyrin repeat-containing protein [Cynara cardunculus var. scolymus]